MQTNSFDSETWKAQRGVRGQDNKRIYMEEALEKAVRVGMSKSEVIRLLGEPDSYRTDVDADLYEIGVSPYGIDEEYYEIRYENGTVASLVWSRR